LQFRDHGVETLLDVSHRLRGRRSLTGGTGTAAAAAEATTEAGTAKATAGTAKATTEVAAKAAATEAFGWTFTLRRGLDRLRGVWTLRRFAAAASHARTLLFGSLGRFASALLRFEGGLQFQGRILQVSLLLREFLLEFFNLARRIRGRLVPAFFLPALIIFIGPAHGRSHCEGQRTQEANRQADAPATIGRFY
jgi:hypothetical protein